MYNDDGSMTNRNNNNNDDNKNSSVTINPLFSSTSALGKRAQTQTLSFGDTFPNLKVITEEGKETSLKALNLGNNLVISMLNLSDPLQWYGPEGKAKLAAWQSIEGANGCTGRAKAIISSHENFIRLNYQLIIIVPNLPHEKLSLIKENQADAYQKELLHAKNERNERLTELFPDLFPPYECCNVVVPHIPVTFVTLTTQSRAQLISEYEHPSFTFNYAPDKSEKFLKATTWVVQDGSIIYNLSHGHVDPDPNSKQPNPSTKEAYAIWEAVRNSSNLNNNAGMDKKSNTK